METLKIVFGFIEIAAAVNFLWVPDLEWGLGLLPRHIVLLIFVIIFVFDFSNFNFHFIKLELDIKITKYSYEP